MTDLRALADEADKVTKSIVPVAAWPYQNMITRLGVALRSAADQLDAQKNEMYLMAAHQGIDNYQQLLDVINAQKAEIERLKGAVQKSYGYLWAVTTRDYRTKKARHILRDHLTHDEQGLGIQMMQQEDQ